MGGTGVIGRVMDDESHLAAKAITPAAPYFISSALMPSALISE